MTINYVSPSQYGIWLTINSIIGWLNFFDIGLGNGLRNKLTNCISNSEIKQAREYISTTYAILIIIAISVFISFSFINPYLHWTQILNITTEREEILQNVIWVGVGCFCVQFVAQLINTILTATHQAAVSSFTTFFGQIFTLIAIQYCINYQPSSLLTLVTVAASAPVITLSIMTIFLFGRKLHKLVPDLKLVNFKHTQSLLNIGGKFFIIQIGGLVLFQTNNIIITKLFGPEQVTIFNTCYKLFSSIIIVFTIIMTPLWSSFTDAYSKSDFRWLKSTTLKMRKLCLLFSIITVVLLIYSPHIFKKWIGQNVSIPFSLSICMAVYVIVYIWQMLHVYLLNGIGKIRLQLFLVTTSALINIPLAIYLGKSFGLEGVIYANVILFILMGATFSFQCELIIKGVASNIWNR